MITLYKLLTNAKAYELDAAATPKVAIIGGTTNDAPPVSIADAPDTAKPAPITNDNVIVQHISLSVGGIKANYSYGVMNAGNVKIQVVSTMKYPSTDTRKLRFIPYPLDEAQFTFKHYKYTTHILTAQNSGYRSPNRPGGSMTYLMGTTRNTTCSIQGIQGSMTFTNTPFILN